MLERPPSSLPDYDNSDGFILDFRAGDWFETLKPMFLTRLTGQELDLAPPGLGAPSLEQYAKDPARFRYVVKLVPAGTSLELVAVKDAGVRTSVTFVRMAGFNEWIGVTLDEHTKVGVNYHLRYNREYFRKIGEETNAVVGEASAPAEAPDSRVREGRFAATPMGAFLHAMAARRATASGPIVLTEEEKARLCDCIGPAGRKYFCGMKVQAEVRADWPGSYQGPNTNALRFTRLTSDGVYAHEMDYTLDGEFCATGSRRVGP